MATDWQYQNRKRPNSASNDQPLKVGLTCSFVRFRLCRIVVLWPFGGGEHRFEYCRRRKRLTYRPGNCPQQPAQVRKI
jgi:hypothetical protein